jgi:primosomal protein N' (replication factor Y)
MQYYEVLVSSPQFHGKEPLTYSSEGVLPVGSIVNVPLRNTPVAGVIVARAAKPSFATKPLTVIVPNHTIPTQTLQLIEWLRQYYPAPLGVFAQLLLPSSLVRKRPLPPVPAPASSASHTTLPPQRAEPQAAHDQIHKTPGKTFLLHGNTGTGKTRLYLELAREALAHGKSVLILTPEIGLTPQLEHTLKSSLGAPILTIHSNLTAADRRTLWLQILQSGAEGGTPVVVVGPRSALFAPIANLGLIVVDEAHDQAYKQEQAPHYHALRVASQLAHLHHATLVLGSATPTIAEYWLAEAKKIPILRLTHRPDGDTHRTTEVISLRDRANFPRQPHLSLALINHIQRALGRKEQSLVFLNRRGTARLVLCQMCGWTATCPRCDLPLTYHGDSHKLLCHTCGFTTNTPSSCPECKSPDIIFKSIGTKSIVEELQREFPRARIQRFDTDNLQGERLEQHYHDVLAGKVDILVGTQMLAKGLDLPKLSVVGVVVADTGLYFPDYTAEEHTYQLLTQVIGRVGRGHTQGYVVIQTYNPDSPAIQAAVHESWREFYAAQLQERKTYGFPPFYYVLKLHCIRASANGAKTASTKLVKTLEQSGLRIQIIGPSPSFHEKQAGKYRWQILVKARDRRELLKVIPLLPANWNYDLDPSNLL